MFWQGRALILGAASLLAACASVDSVPPERIAEMRTKGEACKEALPDVTQFNVDDSGRVWALASGPESSVIERNFLDCVAARGRWATWTGGQPAPMLEPLGEDAPNPTSHIP